MKTKRLLAFGCIAMQVAGVVVSMQVSAQAPTQSSTQPTASDLGKPKATTLCAACHGANGVSVAEHIPNLAGQRAGYLSAQLRAFGDGSRKSDVMSVIAKSLGADDARNVVAFFSSLPAATSAGKSAFLPNVAKTNVTIPADFPNGFTRYSASNDAGSKQIQYQWANAKAVDAAVAGKTLPDGSVIVVENLAAKLDADKKPIIGADGMFVPEKTLSYSAMAREAGWGNDIPEAIRNENWHYALFTGDKKLRTTVNHAECLACHVPAASSSYVFTLKKIAALKK